MHTSSPNIDSGTVVGVVGFSVINGRGTDGDGQGFTCREVIGSARIEVTCRDDDGNTGGDKIVNGADETVESAARAQGDNGRATGRFDLVGDPVNSGNTVLNVEISPRNELLVKWGRTYRNRGRICGKKGSDR